MSDDRINQYPDIDEGTVALATVRGRENIVVLRRKTFINSNGRFFYDWAHTVTAGFTCTNDPLVTDVRVVFKPGVTEAFASAYGILPTPKSK